MRLKFSLNKYNVEGNGGGAKEKGPGKMGARTFADGRSC